MDHRSVSPSVLEVRNSVKSIKFNFAMNFLTTGFSLIFPLITFPYVTRVLGADEYGNFEFANSTANVFLLFAQLGIGLYGTRECAKVRNDRQQLAQVSKELFWVTAISGFVTSIIYVVAVAAIPAFEQRLSLMIICGLAIPFTVLGVNWYFSGTEQFLYVAMRTLVVRIAVVVGMFAFVRTPEDCVKWAAVSVMANSGAYVINFIKMRTALPWKNTGRLELKRHLSPMMGFFLAMASISLYSSFSSMLLGLLSTSAEVGYFAAALKIKNILIAIVTSLTGVLVSRASYYVSARKLASYNVIVTNAMHFVVIVVPLLASTILAFAESIVRIMAGDDFDSAVGPVQLMMIAAVAIALSSVTANVVLTPLGKERLLTLSYVLAGIVGLALNCLLIPWVGAIGAAIGTTIAEATVLIIQLLAIHRATPLSLHVLLSGMGQCLVPVLTGSVVIFLLRALFGDSAQIAIVAGASGCLVAIVGLIVLKETLATNIYRQVLNKVQRK